MSGEWIVVRNSLPRGSAVEQIRRQLRKDFCCSCAYCTMTECEATGVRFEVEHYSPQVSRSDLRTAYNNLMYACHLCNRLKGDIEPTDEHRLAGHRFFKADEDDPRDHFKVVGLRILGTSNVGKFTVTVLYLNSKHLIRIRELRRKLIGVDDVLLAGLRTLKGLKLDQLPAENRPGLLARIPKLVSDIDKNDSSVMANLAEALARSPLLDDLESHKNSGRGQYLDSIDAVTPWRASVRAKTRSQG